MNPQNRIRICVNGAHYSISTAESEEYVQSLAQELDEQIRGVLDRNSNASFNDVIVLCAISYIDAYKRSEENADRMRSQISEYLEDAAKARIELDESKRENAGLIRKLEELKNSGESDVLKQENAELHRRLEELESGHSSDAIEQENAELRRALDALRDNNPYDDLKRENINLRRQLEELRQNSPLKDLMI